MNNLSLSFEGRTVRVLGTPEAPEWVAADVFAILGLGNGKSSAALLPSDEKGVHTVDTPGGRQEVATLLEPGLYRLIFRSRKPEAERFRRWVFHDVLPAIRRVGSYVVPAAISPDVLIRLDALEQRVAAQDRRAADRDINDALIGRGYDSARSSLASGLSKLGRVKLVQDASSAQIAEGQKLLIEGSEPTQVPTGGSKRRAKFDQVAGLLALVESFARACDRGVTARELLEARGDNPLVAGMSAGSLGNVLGRLQGSSFGGLVLCGSGRRPKLWSVVRLSESSHKLTG